MLSPFPEPVAREAPRKKCAQVFSWRGAYATSGTESAHRDYRPAIGTLVAVPRARYHDQFRRFADSGSVHTLPQPQQATRRLIDVGGSTELDFDRHPAALRGLDDHIHFEAGVVAIVAQFGIVSLRVNPQIPNHQRFEEEAEVREVAKKCFR